MHAARLRRNADIAAVWSNGVRLQHGLFAVRARRNDLSCMRLAVSASRAVGSSVTRNRARRRVREAFRGVIGERTDGPGYDLVIVARPSSANAVFADVRTAAAAMLGSVTDRP